MNNTTIFAQNQSNFQILSVCNYILNFSIFLCNEDLVKPNILFEYPHKSKDEYEKKLKLIRETMKKSDFYKNETLCVKYVNETFHNIISKDPFSNYGNIIDYCFSKKKNDKLTLEGIEKILNDILKIFPESEKDTRIMNMVRKRNKRAGDKTNGNHPKRMRIDNELNAQPIDFTDTDNSDDIPKTSLSEFRTPNLSRIENSNYHETVREIFLFKNQGFAFSMRNYRFKQLMFSLALNQNNNLQLNEEISDLWYIQTTYSKAVVHFLLKMKGKEFHFNDITLLTKRTPDPFIAETLEESSSMTEIRYHLYDISLNGFVDLHKFNFEFVDEYITFPNVFFRVKLAHLTHHNKVLHIKLTMNVVSNLNNFLYPTYYEYNWHQRMFYIRNAARFLTMNVPLHTLELSEKILMNYILRDKSTTLVPSYDEFATDYYHHMKVLPKYNDFQIIRNKYIDDVLFNDKLDEIKSLNEAKIRINELYDNHNINIEEIFKFYSISSLYYSMRFEDYYVLFLLQDYKNFAENHIMKNRLFASFYRLGLRQFPINKSEYTIFRFELLDENIINYFKSKVQNNDYYSCVNPKIFHKDKHRIFTEFENHRMTSSEKPTIVQIKMYNHVGLVNVDIPGLLFSYQVITNCLQFKVDNVYEISIGKTQGWCVEMHHNIDEFTDEKKLACMANKLNELLSMPIKYYSDL
ncbi:uncharacterized protein LOC127285117 [Leptopilina boulardi]|uniref:uncharacterized protein LOC127285117 n=1 Tax=Leptopilina boulardi TaxID=63433 RepID=UPI0021F594A3|nr:uncharacterized protein LOC127285117 [Leptopilina boulardi]